MRIKINGDFYEFFNKISIDFKLDSVASAFSFVGLFDTNNSKHRSIFKPLSYNNVEIFDNNNNLVLTGVIVNTNLSSKKTRDLQVLSGYSKPGVLEDSSIPYSSYPLEKINVSLSDIADILLKDFNINYLVDSTVSNEMSLVYKKTVAQPSESVKDYLSKLAAQRNIVISHNEKGDLVFFRPNVNARSKLFLTRENSISMNISVKGQSFHSEISVIRQPGKNNPSLSPVDTIRNPLVLSRRVKVNVLSSGTESETKRAADNILAAELKNISFSISLNRIEDLKCGDIVEVQNPEIYLYDRTRLMISSIKIQENDKASTMQLNLVLPETFTGEIPKNIF